MIYNILTCLIKVAQRGIEVQNYFFPKGIENCAEFKTASKIF